MMAGPVFVYLQWPTLASAMGGDECKLQRREFQVGEARVSVMAVIIRVACGLELWGRRHLVCALLAAAPKFSACDVSFDLDLLPRSSAPADSVMRDVK